jgi:hypothetical protein
MRRSRNRYNTCIPGYNWCGPFCSGPGNPINQVDECCKKHDICYKNRRYGSCSCNRKFRNCLKPLITTKSREGQTAAMLYKIIATLPCVR